MKPKIIQVRGVAFEKNYESVDGEILSILNDIHKGNWRVAEELDFFNAYKSNKKGSHFDVFLGKTGTIIFRPFHYLDGLDNFCYFNLRKYSENNKHAIEFYQWSSK